MQGLKKISQPRYTQQPSDLNPNYLLPSPSFPAYFARMRLDYQFQQQKFSIGKMNLSNDFPTKNPRTAKYATFSQQRKISIQNQANRRIFEKLDSFAKEAAPLPHRLKRPGKIIRNNVNSTDCSKKENDENGKGRREIQRWCGGELINKIRCSQMVNQPEKATFQPLKESKVENNASLQRNTRSMSTHYEMQYANMVSEYERKKEIIYHQIANLRKTEPLTQEKQSNKGPYEDPMLSTETPKFGNHIPAHTSSKTSRARSLSKAAKDPKSNIFLTAIKTQMDLQQKLRKLKHQISIQHQDKITKILQSQYSIDPSITVLDTEQFDPFSQLQHIPIETLAAQLANSHLSAQHNWNTTMQSTFPLALLSDIFSSLQSGKQKGTISLKGFVRQMGILFQNQKYLRNRDLYKIYKRIQPFTRDNFLAVLGKP